MIIDIREDIPDLISYVQRRVDEHMAKAAKQKNSQLVKMIEFGFEFGQANWVALVFDTRENAEPDGEWSRGINRILLKRPRRPIWHELPDNAHVEFIDRSGNTMDVMKNPDDLVCNIIGEALKHVLLAARQQGVFKPLPKTERCELGVENLEGFYGWPAYADRGRENLV